MRIPEDIRELPIWVVMEAFHDYRVAEGGAISTDMLPTQSWLYMFMGNEVK